MLAAAAGGVRLDAALTSEPRDGELILGASRLSQGWRPDRLAGLYYFVVLVPGQHEQSRPARAYWLTDATVSAAAGRHAAQWPSLESDVKLGDWAAADAAVAL